MDKNELIDLALRCGAAGAAVIEGSALVLSRDFRAICEKNQCGLYGKCYMCPPAVGEIETLMDTVRCYPRGLLYQSIAPLEDSFDIEGMAAGKAAHLRLSGRIGAELGELLRGEWLHLSCGGCGLCEVCAQAAGEPCRYPALALSSLEAYGIDVYQSVRPTNLRYVNGPNTVTYFGLALFTDRCDG